MPEKAKVREKKAQVKKAVSKEKAPEKTQKGKTAKKTQKPAQEGKKPIPKESKLKEKKPTKKAVKLPFLTTGKRKRAVARARFRKGSGLVRVNKRPLDRALDRMSMLRVSEAIELAGELIKGYDVDVHVRGGGYSGQAEACRVAIAKGLAELGGEKVKGTYLAYDRNLLVYDPRRTEPHKPPRSSKGSRRYKQRSKR